MSAMERVLGEERARLRRLARRTRGRPSSTHFWRTAISSGLSLSPSSGIAPVSTILRSERVLSLGTTTLSEISRSRSSTKMSLLAMPFSPWHSKQRALEEGLGLLRDVAATGRGVLRSRAPPA